jgi:hypothetical protein
MQSWDGERFTELELGPGLHFVVNSGLAEHGDQPADEAGESPGPADALAANGRTNELARIARFRPLFAAADRPAPQPGKPVARAWGGWLALADGDGLDPGDTRALVVRREMGAGRIWGTTSVSLVAVSAGAVRYDFTGSPGDPAAWYPVIGGPAADLT